MNWLKNKKPYIIFILGVALIAIAFGIRIGFPDIPPIEDVMFVCGVILCAGIIIPRLPGND